VLIHAFFGFFGFFGFWVGQINFPQPQYIMPGFDSKRLIYRKAFTEIRKVDTEFMIQVLFVRPDIIQIYIINRPVQLLKRIPI